MSTMITSRQLEPEVFTHTADWRIAEAFEARHRMVRIAALHSAAAEITLLLTREDRLVQSFERRVSDIEERACFRMFGSTTFGPFTDEEKDMALSLFERDTRAELLRLASTRQHSISKLRARHARIQSIVRTMNSRRMA